MLGSESVSLVNVRKREGVSLVNVGERGCKFG